ncbi:hypothetical protein ACMX2H_15910 [Arthrobacter sulfonylureivorans]|uniref:hypothetical protein n=1 Tax=Arthrobacter sulfonylureivorans TaxID=2486855 RepID=UPI0039E63BAC
MSEHAFVKARDEVQQAEYVVEVAEQRLRDAKELLGQKRDALVEVALKRAASHPAGFSGDVVPSQALTP